MSGHKNKNFKCKGGQSDQKSKFFNSAVSFIADKYIYGNEAASSAEWIVYSGAVIT